MQSLERLRDETIVLRSSTIRGRLSKIGRLANTLRPGSTHGSEHPTGPDHSALLHSVLHSRLSFPRRQDPIQGIRHRDDERLEDRL